MSSVLLSDLGRGVAFYSTEAIIDPPNLTSEAEGSATGTISGLAVGDGVIAFPPYDMQQVAFAAYPSAANTVEIAFVNCGTAAVNLASGTWRFLVFPAGK